MRPILLVSTAAIAAFSFEGCIGGLALHKDYGDYSKAYADATNQQLLLNLARVSRDEPPYYIQLGQITAQHSLTNNASVSPSSVRTFHPSGLLTLFAQRANTIGGTAGMMSNENPSFQFVPLNGDTAGQAVFSPISQKVFLTSFDQGFPADKLARILMQSVESQDVSRSTVNGVVVEKQIGVAKLYVNDPRHPTYPDFLKFCFDLRQDQFEGKSIVRASGGDSTVFSDAKIADAVAAIAAGLSVKNGSDTSKYVLSTPGGASLVKNEDQSQPSENNPAEPPKEAKPKIESYSITRFDGEPTSKLKNPAPGSVQIGTVTTYRMRTFENILRSVAKEDSLFRQNRTSRPGSSKSQVQYKNDDQGVVYGVLQTSRGPIIVLPVLTLAELPSRSEWKRTALASLRYRGKEYEIADYEKDGIPVDIAKEHFASVAKIESLPVAHSIYSNRRTFSLLSGLFTQISIDPKKLPIQQLIQVHSN